MTRRKVGTIWRHEYTEVELLVIGQSERETAARNSPYRWDNLCVVIKGSKSRIYTTHVVGQVGKNFLTSMSGWKLTDKKFNDPTVL